jgi:hypothetical protein
MVAGSLYLLVNLPLALKRHDAISTSTVDFTAIIEEDSIGLIAAM